LTEVARGNRKALTWIEDNITEDFNLLDLANQAGYSPFHFSRLFRFVCGTTIKSILPTAVYAGST
jgi:AraC-like DNA-binding protein